MFNPREAQHDFIVTRSAIAFLFLLVAVFVASFALRDGLRYSIIKLKPASITGLITSVQDESFFKYNAVIEYQYFDEISNTAISGKYIQDKIFDKTKYVEGEKIKIAFSKLIPEINFISDRLYQLEPSFNILMGSAVISVLIIVFLLWNFRKYLKFKKESSRY